ncbi:MAG: glycosyltransferase family 4 protein [Parvularcula sp.]|nr:glycosyltransferase family 4 protein [Parvularcula sp.]
MLHPLRIAHVAPVIYPIPPKYYGGTERVIADLVREQAADHEITVFGPADCDLRIVRQIGEYRSVSAVARTVAEAPPGLAAELEAQQLRDLVRHGVNFGIVHLHGSAHASGVSAALNVPTVRTIHWRADEPDHIEHFDAFPNEKIIAISGDQAQAVPPENLAGIVHHGLPLDRYMTGNGSGNYLVFLGRMTDQKRPDRAIELARNCGLPLKLAGPVDPGNPSYFERAVAPHLSGGIEHIGSVDDAEKQALLGYALALIFPIDWPEPFGLVMIEAMACGTPVIAWDRGSTREIVEDGITGFVVSSLDEAQRAAGKIRQLDRRQVRARFEERFSSERMARETTDLYRRVIAQRSSSPSSASSPSP